MPFRDAFRRYSAAHDVHMVSIPLNDSLDQWHEQEMDFTSYSQDSANDCAQMNAAAINEVADEGIPYLRPSSGSLNSLPAGASPSSSSQYDVRSFTYTQLLNMDSEPSISDASRTSSVSTTSLSTDQSEIAPSAVIQTPVQEKMCPLIAGEIDSCQPARCGPDAPCLNFANLPPIEECTSVPCISPPTNTGSLSPSATRQPKRLLTGRSGSSLLSSSAQSTSRERKTSTLSPQSEPRYETRNRRQLPKADSKARSRLEAKQRAKAAHSLVEKKYRENLNSKLTLLHTTLQNAQYGTRREEEVDSEFEFDANVDPNTRSTKAISKFRKSDILSDAMDYVNQTEVEMRHMENEIQRLSERVRTLEKLVRCEDCTLLKSIVGLQMQPI